MPMNISSSPCKGFMCVPNSDVHTLTRAIGWFIEELERRYGPRDRSWTFIGIEFHDGSPMCAPLPDSQRQIAIKLSKAAADDPKAAIRELAHEAVHLLSPAAAKAPMIEEGVAVAFAKEMTDSLPTDGVYPEALALYEQLVAIDRDAIRILRQCQPSFRAMDERLLMSTIPGVTYDLAQKLCATK